MAITEHYVTSTGTDTYANSTNIATPCSLTTALATAAAGDRINVKVGTYGRTTTADAMTNDGTITSPIIVRGYSSSIGDGYLGRTNGNGALITTNMPTITYTTGRLSATTDLFVIWETLNITGAPSQAILSVGSDSAARACAVTNSSTNASAVGLAVSARGVGFNCDVNLTGASGGSSGASLSGASGTIDSCRISVVSNVPAILISSSNRACFNTIFTSGGIGISMNSTSGAPYIRNNTIYGCTGDGINIITATTTLQHIMGNMITDCTGDGIDMVSTSNGAFTANNRTRDNANGYNNAGDWITATSYGDVASGTTGTSADDYVNPGTDFSLLHTSASTNANQPLYASIGALQRISISGQTSKIG